MSMLNFSVNKSPKNIELPAKLFESLTSWAGDAGTLGLSQMALDDPEDEISALSTSLALLVYDDMLDPKDLRFLNQGLLFKSSRGNQFLVISTQILNDPVLSQKFELSGIECQESGVIQFVTLFDQGGKPTTLVSGNPSGPVHVVLPAPGTAFVMISFSIPAGKQFYFSLLIKDKLAPATTSGIVYHRCDPQVGNDPPKNPFVGGTGGHP